jgi:recombinase, phage RecT family
MAVQNSLMANSKQKLSMAAYMSNDAVKAQINAVVGKHSEGFITSIVSAVQANPALQECSKQSILAAALLGEGLKLSPSPQLGHYYMVPFRNNRQGTVEAQFQLGYKGYLQLAIRSGQYKKINVLAIKEGELIRFNPLEEEIEVNLIDDEVARENADTIGYYAMFEYLNGFKKAIYWSREKMEAHAAKYSKGYATKKGYTFWERDFDSMALKTMLRQIISKWGIMSIDMQTAYEADQAVIREDGTREYVDTEEIVETEPQQKVVDVPVPETPAEPQQTESQMSIEQAFFGN